MTVKCYDFLPLFFWWSLKGATDWKCNFDEWFSLRIILLALSSGARFWKVPDLFERISGGIILFSCIFKTNTSRGTKLWNYFDLYSLYNIMKRPALQKKQVGALRMAFQARKVFETFEKRASGESANGSSAACIVLCASALTTASQTHW